MFFLSRGTPPLRSAAMIALVFALAACGHDPSGQETAVSANTALPPIASAPDATDASDATAQAKASTKLPVPRRGAPAPVDAEPDKRSVLQPGWPGKLILRADFETSPGLETGSDHAPSGRLTNQTGSDARSWLNATIENVTGPDNQPTRALALYSSGTGHKHHRHKREGIALEYHDLPNDPGLYQRMRVKFDASLLDRARSLGSRNFELTFWEARSATRRYRLQLVYHHSRGLIWQAHTDTLARHDADHGAEADATDVCDPHHLGSRHLDRHELDSHPVTLAEATSAHGWHTVEIWLDRDGSTFMVAVDGHTLADGKTGESRADPAPVDTVRPAMVAGTPDATVLFDDLELYTAPPPDAWGAGS